VDIRLWLANQHQFGVRKKQDPIILDSLNTHIHGLGTKFCHSTQCVWGVFIHHIHQAGSSLQK